MRPLVPWRRRQELGLQQQSKMDEEKTFGNDSKRSRKSSHFNYYVKF